ncbi:hypothetical protein [Ideonella sp. YS5]|uniref:hypothetical protein n=1 Tax=Ideonella sp. YS5 TaxID=3453714 RepID=UPI003EEF44D3
MATALDRELKRQITVNGAAYTVVLDPQGMRLVGKGKRRPEVELRWSDLLSGEAALAVALNASLSGDLASAKVASAKGATGQAKLASKRPTR